MHNLSPINRAKAPWEFYSYLYRVVIMGEMIKIYTSCVAPWLSDAGLGILLRDPWEINFSARRANKTNQ
jgi:hypothetical protein